MGSFTAWPTARPAAAIAAMVSGPTLDLGEWHVAEVLNEHRVRAAPLIGPGIVHGEFDDRVQIAPPARRAGQGRKMDDADEDLVCLSWNKCSLHGDSLRFFPRAVFSTRPGRLRSRRPFCFCPDRAPAPRRRDARCIRTSGRGPARWRRRRDTAALRARPLAAIPATRLWDFRGSGMTLKPAERRLEFAENEFARRFKTAVQKNRAEQRLVTCPPAPKAVRGRRAFPRRG